MKTNRRGFIRSAGMVGAGLTFASTTLAKCKSKPEVRSMAPLKILILGGTGFIGPNTVRYAVERGHEVAIFTRGSRKSETPRVEHLIGDRNDDLSALKGRKWDVVLDNNALDYRWVKLSTETLKDSVDHYVFISSIAAYDFEPYDSYQFKNRVVRDFIITPDFKTVKPPADWKEGDKAPYGLTKSLSEKIIKKAFPDRHTIVRPGIIMGPGDPTNRWSYFLERIAEGGEMMGPGNPEHSYQVIDQRDVTEWIVRLGENKTMGYYNAVGPASRMSMQQMFHAIWGAVGSNISFTWVPEDFLEEQGIQVYQDVPGWVPGHNLRGVNNETAIDVGLTFRPMAISAIEHLEWERARSKEGDKDRRSRQHGISRQREKEILEAWKKNRR